MNFLLGNLVLYFPCLTSIALLYALFIVHLPNFILTDGWAFELLCEGLDKILTVNVFFFHYFALYKNLIVGWVSLSNFSRKGILVLTLIV